VALADALSGTKVMGLQECLRVATIDNFQVGACRAAVCSCMCCPGRCIRTPLSATSGQVADLSYQVAFVVVTIQFIKCACLINGRQTGAIQEARVHAGLVVSRHQKASLGRHQPTTSLHATPRTTVASSHQLLPCPNREPLL
jgi:hypothetical protein